MDNKQTLILEERKKLRLNAVSDIASFSDDYLELSTILGKLCVEGEGMKIESLSHESGEILISGEISGIFYQHQSLKKKSTKKK